MDEVTIHFLIKIGKRQFMYELYELGLIFMNDLNYFIQYEENELRGDKEEGLSRIEQATNIKILHNGNLLAHSNSAQLKLRDYNVKGNIYSLIAITSLDNPKKIRIDKKNKKLGDYFVLIYNVKEFIQRFKNKINDQQYEYEYNLVKYYNPKEYSGPLNVFCKQNNFEYQQEFRFFIKRNDSGPLKITIGSIQDIADIHNIERFVE